MKERCNFKEIIIDKIIFILKEIEEIRFVFLHGSYTETDSYHDIDIAVYFDSSIPDEIRLTTIINLSTQLTADLQLPIDINDLNSASLSFAYHASCGKLLFYRDLEEVYNYQEEIWIKYMDFYPFLKQNLLDLLEV